MKKIKREAHTENVKLLMFFFEFQRASITSIIIIEGSKKMNLFIEVIIKKNRYSLKINYPFTTEKELFTLY